MLAFKTVVLSALALTNIAIAAPLASPAGGPQGPSNYDLGTVLNFAVLQPSGEDFICSNYTTGTSSGGSAPVFVNGHSSGDPTPPLQFVVTSTSDSDDSQAIDFVGLQGYGVVLDSEGQVVIEEGETTDGFFVNGHILGHAFAPDGFYYCHDPANPDGSGGVIGAEDATLSHAKAEGCSDPAFVAFTTSQ